MRSTLKDISEKVGVSAATVSLVLNGKKGVGDEVRAKVLSVAKELNYPIRINKGLDESQVKTRYKIHFLFEKLKTSPFADIFYGEILQGLEEEARINNCSVSFALVDRNENFPQLISNLRSMDTDGLIIIGGGSITDKLLEIIRKKVSKPILLLDNFVIGKKYNCVLVDNVIGGYQATKHLIENGHKDIGVIRGPKYYKSLIERFEGFLEAMDEFHLPVRKEWIIETDHGEYIKGYSEMKQVLSQPRVPTAIFAISDKTAFGAMEAIRESGLNIPKDISIIGFDDVHEARLTVPRLTTIRVPKMNIGRVAVDKIRSLIEKKDVIPSKTVLYIQLVVRETVGPPSKNSAREKIDGQNRHTK